MKRLTIEELRKKLDEGQEKAITESYLKGLSRDKTALIVNKNKNVIQSYFDWLRLSDEYNEIRNNNKKELKRTKPSGNEHSKFESFRDLYLQGASIMYIKNTLHISSNTASQYVKHLPEDEIKLHYESIEHNKSINEKYVKELKKQFEITVASDFFGRDVKNRQFDVYGRIDFINQHLMFNYNFDGTVDTDEGHLTQIITKGIKSKGDFVEFLSIIKTYKDDISNTNVPYIKDFKRNRVYSITDYADLIGVDID